MEKTFSATDWVVFVLTLLIPSAIGIYHAFTGGRQKTTREFLMANRNMSFLPVAISILVSFQSAILILGAPAEMYTKGTQYYLYTFGQMFAVILATQLFVPLFFPLKVTSIYEYVEKRYDSKVARITGTVINNLSTLVYTGIASFAPSTALQAVSGFPEYGSFILIGCICTFYTFMGGLKSVIWVDVFQALIMVCGILAILIKASLEVGGFGKVWSINDKWGRIDFWNFDPDPTTRHTFWALVIGGMLNWVGTYGASQASIQRFNAVGTLRDAKKAVLINCVGVFVLLTLVCLTGISIFAYYASKGCDPISEGYIKNSNQIVPFFVSDVFGYPGLPGLFIACLFCGALSSLSSNLSSMVAVTWEDILKPFFDKKSEGTKAWITRLLVLVYGVLGIGSTFLFRNLKGTVLQASLSFMGAGGGALNGLIMLGAFFPWANSKGAIMGSISAYALTMWIGIGKYTVVGVKENLPFPNRTCSGGLLQNFTSIQATTTELSMITHSENSISNDTELSGLDRFYSLSYLWYSTFALVVAFVIGLTTSFITGPTNPKDVDSKYTIPIFDRLFPCGKLTKLREFIHCGVQYKGKNQKYSCDQNEDISDITMDETTGSKTNLHDVSYHF